jgi:hypothetical protein
MSRVFDADTACQNSMIKDFDPSIAFPYHLQRERVGDIPGQTDGFRIYGYVDIKNPS